MLVLLKRNKRQSCLWAGHSTVKLEVQRNTGHWSLVCSTQKHVQGQEALHILLCVKTVSITAALGIYVSVSDCLRSGSPGLWKLQWLWISVWGNPLFPWLTQAERIITYGLIRHTTSTLTRMQRQSGLWSLIRWWVMEPNTDKMASNPLEGWLHRRCWCLWVSCYSMKLLPLSFSLHPSFTFSLHSYPP